MLSLLRNDDSCFNISKYYHKKKKTESFNYDNFVLNSKTHRVLPSFLSTFRKSASSYHSLSQRDLILPIISRNSSLNDLQYINDYKHLNNERNSPEVKQKYFNQPQRPRLNILKLIFEEDDKSSSHSNKNLFGNTIKEPDIDYFLSKIVEFKPEIVKKINEALVLDNFYDYHVKRKINETNLEFERALLNQGRFPSTHHHFNNNQSKEFVSPKIAIKYITYEQIINGVVSHCLEVKNSTNKLLTIMNITNYFEEEVQRVRNKYKSKNQGNQGEVKDALMNQIIPIKEAKIFLRNNEDDKTIPSNKPCFISNDLNSGLASDRKPRPSLNHENFNHILHQITQKVLKSTTNLNKEISNELKKEILYHDHFNNKSIGVIEDEFNLNNEPNFYLKRLPYASLSLMNKCSLKMKNYLMHLKGNTMHGCRSFSHIEEQNSRNVIQSNFNLNLKGCKGNKSKTATPSDTDNIRLNFDEKIIDTIQNEKTYDYQNKKGVNIIDMTTNAILSTVREMKKTIEIMRKKDKEKNNDVMPCQYEMIEKMVHLNTEMEFLKTITRGNMIKMEMKLSNDEALLQNRTIKNALKSSQSQRLLIIQNYKRKYVDNIDCVSKRNKTFIDYHDDNRLERSKRVTGRLRWVRVIDKTQKDNDLLPKDITPTQPTEIEIKGAGKGLKNKSIKIKANDKASIKGDVTKKKPIKEQRKIGKLMMNSNMKSNTKSKQGKQSKSKSKIQQDPKEIANPLTGKHKGKLNYKNNNVPTEHLDRKEKKRIKDKTAGKVTLLAKKFHETLNRQYGPRDRFNSVNYLFQHTKMKINIKERPSSTKGMGINNYIKLIPGKTYLNKTRSFFPEKFVFVDLEKVEKPIELNKTQINYLKNEQKNKYLKNAKKNANEKAKKINTKGIPQVSSALLLKTKEIGIESYANAVNDNKDTDNERNKTMLQSLSPIKQNAKKTNQSNTMILLHNNSALMFSNKKGKEGNDATQNLSNEESSQSSQTNTVENSLMKIRAEAQKQQRKNRKAIGNKFKPYAKTNKFGSTSMKQDELVTPLAPVLLYKKRDMREEIEHEEERREEVDILFMFREISSLTPDDYTKKMTEFLDLQLFRSDHSVKNLLEERLNKFKDNLAQNLNKKREYQSLIGSKIKFQNQSVVSLFCFILLLLVFFKRFWRTKAIISMI